MLRYLDDPDPGPGACGGCDACTPDLPRPWEEIEVRAEDVQEAVRETALPVILMLIEDEGGRRSRRNLIRTLRGDGGGSYPLNRRLVLHGCFGRLGMLPEEQVEELVQEAVENGYVEEVQVVHEGRRYMTLRLTPEGREVLRGRYLR